MDEIIQEFCLESEQLCQDLLNILEALEDNPNEFSKLEEFGQVVDRIMGAAAFLDTEKITFLCKLSKVVGYKSSQCGDPNLVNIVIAVLEDAVELIQELTHQLKKHEKEIISAERIDPFISRLEWLVSKFNNIDRSSVAIDQDAFDGIMKRLKA